MGGMYIAGALIYGARVPERWFPGTFDIWVSEETKKGDSSLSIMEEGTNL